MAELNELKQGTRVKITLEGTLQSEAWASTEATEHQPDLLSLEVLWDGIKDPVDYTDISDIPLTAIEVVVPPRAEGLYYNGPIPTTYCPQASNVYKYQYGKWFNWRGEEAGDVVEELMVPLAVDLSGR